MINPLKILFRLTDEEAMERVQQADDPEAFAQLMARWQAPIMNLCFRMTGDFHRGQDLAQEAFARVFAHRKSYKPTARFSTYLWRIALNLCHDELRKTQRRKELALDQLGDETIVTLQEFISDQPGPDLIAQQKETAVSVREALSRLPEIYRQVLVLRHYEQLKFSEIAEVLEIPEGTVKSRMFEGLSQMGRLLNQESALKIPRSFSTKPERLLL